MASYLEAYLESISSLPQDIRKKFALLTELDNRSHQLLQSFDKEMLTYSKQTKKSRQTNAETEQKLRAVLREAQSIAQYKTTLVNATYELVDKHIQQLDQDLRKFEVEVEYFGPDKPTVTPTDLQKRTSTRDPKISKKKKVEINPHPIIFEPLQAPVRTEPDMPVDPNEPVYCLCRRVSFGEMVGCDNPECKTEWFHFECVGLNQPPKGKWLCPECTRFKR